MGTRCRGTQDPLGAQDVTSRPTKRPMGETSLISGHVGGSTGGGGVRLANQLEFHDDDLACGVLPDQGELAACSEVAAGASGDRRAEGQVGVADHAIDVDVATGQPQGALVDHGAVVSLGHDELDGVAGADPLARCVVQDRHPGAQDQVPGAESFGATVDDALVTALERESEEHGRGRGRGGGPGILRRPR
jgi:hypothetical protein